MIPVNWYWYDGGIKPERPAELLPMKQWAKTGAGGNDFRRNKGKLMAGLFGENPHYFLFKNERREVAESNRPFVERGSEGHQTQWTNACKKGYGAYTSSSFDQSGP
jgi:hypothetical protein